MRPLLILPLLLLPLSACDDVEGTDGANDPEAMTTVEATFTPQGGGDAIEVRWADPELDGEPVVDDIVLSDADDYDVALRFLNEQEEPFEDVTPEIADEELEHQVFFTGPGVEGPATLANAAALVEHAYADEDAGGLPIGLANTITTVAVGTSEITITLRHMPPEEGEDVKIAGLADEVANNGFGNIGGSNDVSVTFPLEVQ